MNKEKKTIEIDKVLHMRIFCGAAMVGKESFEDFLEDAVDAHIDKCNNLIKEGKDLPVPAKKNPKVKSYAQLNAFLTEFHELARKHGVLCDGPFGPEEMGLGDFVDTHKRFVMTLVHNGYPLAE